MHLTINTNLTLKDNTIIQQGAHVVFDVFILMEMMDININLMIWENIESKNMGGPLIYPIEIPNQYFNKNIINEDLTTISIYDTALIIKDYLELLLGIDTVTIIN